MTDTWMLYIISMQLSTILGLLSEDWPVKIGSVMMTAFALVFLLISIRRK